jgi:hypothetical protein
VILSTSNAHGVPGGSLDLSWSACRPTARNNRRRLDRMFIHRLLDNRVAFGSTRFRMGRRSAGAAGSSSSDLPVAAR